jgi:hypothetical protein
LRDEVLGDGPVRVRALTAEGAPISKGELWDATRGACTPFRFADGTRYCVPLDTLQNVPTVFQDAACTRPIVLHPFACGSAGEVVTIESGMCNDVVLSGTVKKLGAALEVTEVWEDLGAGCSGPVATGPRRALEVVGTATAAATFSVVERVTE